MIVQFKKLKALMHPFSASLNYAVAKWSFNISRPRFAIPLTQYPTFCTHPSDPTVDDVIYYLFYFFI